jgi:glucose-1-phosphate adenylyltransferase
VDGCSVADAVYALDYEAVVREHLALGAAVTMVTTRVAQEDAGRYGVVEVEDGRVSGYSYKPGEQAGEDGPGDLGDGLLPRLVAKGAAREHRLEGYWRDLGTVDAYWSAHMDLVADEPPYDPGDPDWPLTTEASHHPLARVDGTVLRSLLSPGVRVSGRVERSVLSPGVVVEDGATVEHSVLLHDVVVRRGALDSGVEVTTGVSVGGQAGDIVLVGRGEQITRDLPAGGSRLRARPRIRAAGPRASRSPGRRSASAPTWSA